MAPRMHDRGFQTGARQSGSWAGGMRTSRKSRNAGALLVFTASALLTGACNAPVAPHFELSFEGAGITTCGAAAAERIRLMCDSTVRLRIRDARRIRDLVPPVCQELASSEIGTMEALDRLDIQLADLPLGPAVVEVEIWRSDWIDLGDCSVTGGPGGPDQLVLEPGDNPQPDAPAEQPAATPAVVGRAAFEIGRDAHVRIPLTCPDLAQVNRFGPGCGLDLEIGNLDRGTNLRQAPLPPAGGDPEMLPGQEVGDSHAPGEPAGDDTALDALEVRYGYAHATYGSWTINTVPEHLAVDVLADGSTIWRARPTDAFWEELTDAQTLCIQVIERNPDGSKGPPQVSCVEVAPDMPSWRLQTSYLPRADLECLLAASGTGGMPPEGIVMGRVVQPVEEAEDEVQPAANVQVVPLAADLPDEPNPRVGPIGEPDGTPEEPIFEDVLYVSKEPETDRTGSLCRVDDAIATTPSGYFLSDASFPAHWDVTTDPGEQPGDSDSLAEQDPASDAGETSSRILVGGRIPGIISIVRIALQ
jgi:hypothetical protein